MKPKGEIKQTEIINVNIQLLDGHYCHKAQRVPMVLVDYIPDENDLTPHQFKFWLKLENVRIITEEQRIKNLKEISIWLDEPDVQKLLDILQNRKRKRQ